MGLLTGGLNSGTLLFASTSTEDSEFNEQYGITISYIANIQSQQSSLLEHNLSLTDSRNLTISHLLQLSSNLDIILEYTRQEALSFDLNIPIEYRILLDTIESASMEYLVQLSRDIEIPASYKASIDTNINSALSHNLNTAKTASLIVSWLHSLDASKDTPIEWVLPGVITIIKHIILESSLLLNASATANLSHTLQFNDDSKLHLENKLGISGDSNLQYSNLGSIDSPISLIISNLSEVLLDKGIVFSTTGELLINRSIVIEWNRFDAFSVDINVPIEHLIRIDGDYYIPIEWFGEPLKGKILKWILTSRNTDWNLPWRTGQIIKSN